MTKLSKNLLLALVATSAVAMAAPAQAKDLGDGYFSKERFQVRLRAIGILADGDGTVDGSSTQVDADHAYTPEIDLTYFFTENLAAELIAATAKHTVSAGGSPLGDVWVLPPTLTLQYHFMPDSKFSPYIGAGVNYTVFYGEDDASGVSDFDVGNGFGLAAQVGFDYWINDHWGVNADVKYIDVDVDASISNGATTASDVGIDPWVVGLGVSYRF